MQRTYEETDEMCFILNVYAMGGCKETLQELCEMTLPDIMSLREFLEVRSSYKEEVAFNEYRKAQG